MLVFNKTEGNRLSININLLLKLIFGVMLGTLFLFVFAMVIDGPDIWKDLYKSYFGTFFKLQTKGRAAGGLPPFYLYLFEPTVLISIIGSVWSIFSHSSSRSRVFGVVSIIQSIGLL